MVGRNGMESEMTNAFAKVRWLRLLGAAAAVIGLSLLVLMGVTMVYAFVLAFQVLGAPDQTAINRFAATISPPLMPWLEALMTFLVAWRRSRAADASKFDGVLLGILSGLLSAGVVLVFGGSLSLRSLVVLIALAGLGWLGGVAGNRWRARD